MARSPHLKLYLLFEIWNTNPILKPQCETLFALTDEEAPCNLLRVAFLINVGTPMLLTWSHGLIYLHPPAPWSSAVPRSHLGLMIINMLAARYPHFIDKCASLFGCYTCPCYTFKIQDFISITKTPKLALTLFWNHNLKPSPFTLPGLKASFKTITLG